MRLTYSQVEAIIRQYAPEMLSHFTDRWSRFPEGGQASMIINYLTDRGREYYDLGLPEIGEQLAQAGGEIIARCG